MIGIVHTKATTGSIVLIPDDTVPGASARDRFDTFVLTDLLLQGLRYTSRVEFMLPLRHVEPVQRSPINS